MSLTVEMKLPRLSRPGGASPPAWSPLDLGADLEAWYPNSFLASVGDGNPIAQWDDASGNARHASEATGVAQPVCTLADGLLESRGDGVDDKLTTAAITIAQPYAFCAAVRFISTTTNRIALGDMTGGTGGPRVLVSGAATLASQASAGNVIDGPAIDTSWHYVIALFNGAGSYIRVDGVEFAESTGTAAFRGACLHARSPANAHANSAIREWFIVSKVPTAGEIASVDAYLSTFMT